jgi:hypothetical protein
MKYLVNILVDEDMDFDFVLCEKEALEQAKEETDNFVLLNTNREWNIEILEDGKPCLIGNSTDDEIEWSEV